MTAIIRIVDAYDEAGPTAADVYYSLEESPGPGDEVVGIDDLTVDDLIQALDDDATGANYHHFVGWAARLVAIVDSLYPGGVLSPDLAKRILWGIATRGGFTGGA